MWAGDGAFALTRANAFGATRLRSQPEGTSGIDNPQCAFGKAEEVGASLALTQNDRLV